MPEEPLIQKYWYKGKHPERPKLVTRSYTKNARNPSPAQAAQRLRVGDISKLSKGMKMDKGDSLPPAARLVKQFASRPTGVQRKENTAVWERELMEYIDNRVDGETEKEKAVREVFQILEGVGA